MLDARVEDVLHVVAARVGDDRAVAERARPELHPPLEPADDVAGGDAFRDCGVEVVVHASRREPGRSQRSRAFRVRVLRPRVRVLHDEVARPTEHLVPDEIRGADGDAVVARGGLDVQLVERRLSADPTVRDRVERDAAREAEVGERRSPLRDADRVQIRLFEDGLERACDVLVVPRQLIAGRAGAARTRPRVVASTAARSSASPRPRSCRRRARGA